VHLRFPGFFLHYFFFPHPASVVGGGGGGGRSLRANPPHFPPLWCAGSLGLLWHTAHLPTIPGP